MVHYVQHSFKATLQLNLNYEWALTTSVSGMRISQGFRDGTDRCDEATLPIAQRTKCEHDAILGHPRVEQFLRDAILRAIARIQNVPSMMSTWTKQP